MRFQERLAFWRQFHDQFQSTGAIQPSSRFLARAMAEPLREQRPGRGVRIVEMGPGTGAVTLGIVEAMSAEDRLDCFELNPEFATYLRRRIAEDGVFRTRRQQIRVHTGDAREIDTGPPADFVVCSVPLNNLDAGSVAAILAAGERALAGSGWFTYFEYVALPSVGRWLAGPAERKRIDDVQALKASFGSGRSRGRVVLANLPPARSVHVEISARADAADRR